MTDPDFQTKADALLSDGSLVDFKSDIDFGSMELNVFRMLAYRAGRSGKSEALLNACFYCLKSRFGDKSESKTKPKPVEAKQNYLALNLSAYGNKKRKR